MDPLQIYPHYRIYNSESICKVVYQDINFHRKPEANFHCLMGLLQNNFCEFERE